MNLTSSIRDVESPGFYFELGELISSTGNEHFASNMLNLIDKLVPVERIDLSEWTLDERQASVVDIEPLGCAGLKDDSAPPELPQHPDTHPLLSQMIEMDDSLLIQMNAQVNRRDNRDAAHQCNLVSRKSNRRCVISLYRSHTQKGFALGELSFLKNLSDTLLPLIERHAQISRQAVLKNVTSPMPGPQAEQEPVSLQQAFSKRLALGDIILSSREREVCLGLLVGGTVPQMAEKLSVKNSSVETYLKRAAAKLGVSGRHGLARWMAGA
ncbi:helix-turn-helix transcriptional regulator [Pseudomonas gingeri]|uniref:helix-turn-helix transcriptional regulator n=1 Tax=Pseudomonas gingeri TaxID=117681 RepID=UPI0015A1ADA0|nr:helix-turn-helix transcriptional regulator [Pseudomonas gingeri]NWA03250.1 helix-turn-helix transcriptional regulator [Pseudomonas gingeri]NWA14107.1 helix-turn-helix transcriptional regulator [Pseudomonas gingeri]NWA55275.1 helix-turn-helix transcriptional regulator [Pseudomonas gingeri]NWA94999.1 helix-turn-helix transcriptional regulator [Pseudomonas gingeri]NWB01655.1 helix-turn-helix transcriptional regulator [Pseudomonas gingeri]